MDFAYDFEQQQLAAALRRWLDKEYSFARRKAIIDSSLGVSDQAWSALVELGLTALPVPAAHGGFGGSAVDMLVVMQELGRSLVVEPYFATVLGAEFLKIGGAHPALLEQVALGSLKLACALGEKQARHDMRQIQTSICPTADGYLLNGEKTAVLHGGQAHALIVSARSTEADAGMALLVVPFDAEGVAIRDYRTQDGQRAATIRFTDVALAAGSLIGRPGSATAGREMLDCVLDYGAALLCFEAIGALEAMFAATLEHLQSRTQFGVPIGKFQVLQHRMADMYIHLEQARSMALLAAVKLDAGNMDERRWCVSAAKVRIGQAIKFIGQQAVQLHGAMGLSNAVPLAHYFKRLTMLELTLGNTDHHLRRFMAQPRFQQRT